MCSCRKGEDINKEYDIIIRNVADDDVFKTVDMYFRGLWDKPKVLEELRYYKRNEDEFYKQNLENESGLFE